MENLLGSSLAAHFEGGSISVHRLAPQDYHRYHLPCKCTVESRTPIGKEYWTVNPVAVNSAVDVFTENKRVVCVFQSPVFGKIAYVCVGAMMAGGMEFYMPEGSSGNKGDQYGCFKFGGSTIICVWEKDSIAFDRDLLSRSEKSIETLVKMGQTLGVKAHL